MDLLLNRYRNITVLLIVIVAQLLLLAYQVKTNKDVPLIRVWAVSTVTPVEAGLEFVRRHTIGYVEDYFVLVNVREQNDQLKRELAKTKLENHFLRAELATADRAKQLTAFQQDIPSKTLAARVIGNGTGANSKVVFIDRGSGSGIERGMAVITPDGIVGKIVAAYPTASLMMLITDPSFAAGVISQKNHVHGTLKGQGGPKCKVAYVQNEEKVEPGEMFFTSGDDGVFPRGFPVGQVTSVTNGRSSKEIYVAPSGWQGGLDEVLVVTEGVHQPIPEPRMAAAPVKIMPPPADQKNEPNAQSAAAALNTDADKLRREYEQISEQEKIRLGTGSKPPDFSKLGQKQPSAAPTAATPGMKPSTTPAATAAKPPVPSAAAPNGAAAAKAPATQPGATTLKPKPRPSDDENDSTAEGNAYVPAAKPKSTAPRPAAPPETPPPPTPRTNP